MEENFRTVAGSSIESELFAAHNPWVPHASEINAKLIAKVLAKHLVEYFRLAVNRRWL